jgi:hypothetical protein
MTVRIIGVPIDSEGGTVGTTFMPAVLREEGLIAALLSDVVDPAR